ncbi:hypothetical protein EIP86_005785 [Pleurotus ostreatoroseus]|nr:hypothetical protein EIP86_005785 [Pleurotus ostreatoroseus]
MTKRGSSASEAARKLNARVAELNTEEKKPQKLNKGGTKEHDKELAALRKRIAELEETAGGTQKVKEERKNTTQGRRHPPPHRAKDEDDEEEDSSQEPSGRPPPEKVACKQCAERAKPKKCTWNKRTTQNGACDACITSKRRCEVPGKKNVDRKRKGSPLVQQGKRAKSSARTKGKGKGIVYVYDSSAEEMRSEEESEDSEGENEGNGEGEGDGEHEVEEEDGDDGDGDGEDEEESEDEEQSSEDELRSDDELRSPGEVRSDDEMRSNDEMRSEDEMRSSRKGRSVHKGRKTSGGKLDNESEDAEMEGEEEKSRTTLTRIAEELRHIKTSLVRMEDGFQRVSDEIPEKMQILVTLSKAYNEYLAVGENEPEDWGEHMDTKEDGGVGDIPDDEMVVDGSDDAVHNRTEDGAQCKAEAEAEKSPGGTETSKGEEAGATSANTDTREDGDTVSDARGRMDVKQTDGGIADKQDAEGGLTYGNTAVNERGGDGPTASMFGLSIPLKGDASAMLPEEDVVMEQRSENVVLPSAGDVPSAETPVTGGFSVMASEVDVDVTSPGLTDAAITQSISHRPDSKEQSASSNDSGAGPEGETGIVGKEVAMRQRDTEDTMVQSAREGSRPVKNHEGDVPAKNSGAATQDVDGMTQAQGELSRTPAGPASVGSPGVHIDEHTPSAENVSPAADNTTGSARSVESPRAEQSASSANAEDSPTIAHLKDVEVNPSSPSNGLVPPAVAMGSESAASAIIAHPGTRVSTAGAEERQSSEDNAVGGTEAQGTSEQAQKDEINTHPRIE